MVKDKNASLFQVGSHTTEAEIARQKPFWIHAASGEIEYARPVIRALKGAYPQVPILVTYSSPSAKKMLGGLQNRDTAERAAESIDAWGPLPWEFQKDCEAFLNRWQPRASFVARTDVWPVMAEATKAKNIPSLLFAATFAENSSRLHGLSAQITMWALNQLCAIHCVSKDDADAVKKLNLTVPVSVEGDTRFNQVLYRLNHPRPLKNSLQPIISSSDKMVFVAGSTWPEDEAVLLPAYRQLKESLRLILVPHEVDESHLSKLEALIREQGLRSFRYSQRDHWLLPESQGSPVFDIMIVDQIGILAEIYTWGDIAFVGGSFRKQVHSVMEPLAAGLPVFVGPYHRNNREALLFKSKVFDRRAAVSEVRNSDELVQKLIAVIEEPAPRFALELTNSIKTLAHSTEAILQWCKISNCDAESLVKK